MLERKKDNVTKEREEHYTPSLSERNQSSGLHII